MPIRTLSKELIAEIQGSIRHLTTLNLSNNEISQIQNLEPLASLTKLDLGRNRIGAIGGLDALRELAHLDLSGNRIEAVGGLDRLGALEVLVLADNRIGRFEALRTLVEVATLQGWSEIMYLAMDIRGVDKAPLPGGDDSAVRTFSAAAFFVVRHSRRKAHVRAVGAHVDP